MGTLDPWDSGLEPQVCFQHSLLLSYFLCLCSRLHSKGLGVGRMKSWREASLEVRFEHLRLSRLQPVSLTLWHIQKTLISLGHLMINRGGCWELTHPYLGPPVASGVGWGYHSKLCHMRQSAEGPKGTQGWAVTYQALPRGGHCHHHHFICANTKALLLLRAWAGPILPKVFCSQSTSLCLSPLEPRPSLLPLKI